MATKGLRVRDLMTKEVRTVGRNDKVSDADALMDSARVRHLPVLDDAGALAGILSRRDVYRTALRRTFGYGEKALDQILGNLVVKELMTSRVETAAPDDALADAARRMLEKGISSLVVVEGARVVGMLTESDFVRHLAGGKR
jgi:CBS domain-containing membrane protein